MPEMTTGGTVIPAAVVPSVMKTVLHVSSPHPDDQNHAAVNTLNLIGDEAVYSEGDDVVVLANGAGVRMFVDTTAAHPEMIERLADRGVALRACRNALYGMGATDDDLLPGVSGVPSGSGELARLQDDGFGYIKAP